MRVCEAPQRTHDWFACRAGRLTASRMPDLMALPKINKDGSPRGGKTELARRKNYVREVLIERLTGRPSDHFVHEAMRHGNEMEPIARTAWERTTGMEADLIGFVFHPRYDFTGASPDFLAGEDGGTELKCPTSDTHMEYLEADIVPEEYRDQMYWNMACAEREWWDFFSFDDRFLSKELKNFRKRLYRDEKRIAEIEQEVLRAHAEIEYRIAEMGEESMLPPIEAFMSQVSSETVRIGELDVPADLADLLDRAEMIP